MGAGNPHATLGMGAENPVPWLIYQMRTTRTPDGNSVFDSRPPDLEYMSALDPLYPLHSECGLGSKWGV
jgi:hypothetical protein